jgi:hypothetical protein
MVTGRKREATPISLDTNFALSFSEAGEGARRGHRPKTRTANQGHARRSRGEPGSANQGQTEANSSDGNLVALPEQNTIAIFEADTGRRLQSVPKTPAGRKHVARGVSPLGGAKRHTFPPHLPVFRRNSGLRPELRRNYRTFSYLLMFQGLTPLATCLRPHSGGSETAFWDRL